MSSGGDYKPTEHDGLKKDGTPDKRVGTGGTLLTIFYLSFILIPLLASIDNYRIRTRKS